MAIWVFNRCQPSLGSRFNSCHKESTVFNLSTKDLEPHGNNGGEMNYEHQNERFVLKLFKCDQSQM